MVARELIARRRIAVAASLAAFLLPALLVTRSQAVGSPGRLGPSAEPFFPQEGDPNYDALNYSANLDYQVSSGSLTATETMTARAKGQLSGFSVDLDGLQVATVTVNGAPAGFRQIKDKLQITPATPLPAGSTFEANISYGGQPRTITGRDGFREGWVKTSDGALALGEPVGTPTWLPCNNVPADKATFQIAITVPAGLTAVSNGILTGSHESGGSTTWEWSEHLPMSTYLAVVDIGKGELIRGEVDGLPSWTFVDPSMVKLSRGTVVGLLPKILRFEIGIFGPYPFDSVGSIVDSANLDYALETQTRPTYAVAPAPGISTVVHEMAHQWFGDSVGLENWPEIWLNEGFATWTEWFYSERHHGLTAREAFREYYRVPASSPFWSVPPGRPHSLKVLFGAAVNKRGAMTLEALRLKIGTPKLLRILRSWTREHRYGSATIGDFIALAEQASGQHLRRFFHTWLFHPGKPPGYGGV